MNNILDVPSHTYFPKNTKGRDFFVGDIHGEYYLLKKALSRINFNFGKDRLFSTGDLIDRGEDSLHCLLLAREDWLIPVCGNHEVFLSDADDSNIYKKAIWRKNGGGWWDKLDDDEKLLARETIQNYFHLTLTVETNIGNVGVVHAQYPLSFWPLGIEQSSLRDVTHELLWGRNNIENEVEKYTEGVRYIVSGHNSITKPRLLGNQLFIDTGCGYSPSIKIHNPHLTICEFNDSNIRFFHTSKCDFYQTELEINEHVE